MLRAPVALVMSESHCSQCPFLPAEITGQEGSSSSGVTQLFPVPLFFFLRFNLFERERKKERASEQTRDSTSNGEGEADSPLSREPNAGLDPRTLRS